MSLYSDEELKQIREFTTLEEALRDPEKVIRFSAYQHEDAASLARIVELRNLQSLSISLSNVTELLPRLGELVNLQDLYFQACNISLFPDSILSLRNLRSLALGNNGLSHVPEEVGQLVKLESIGFGQNEIQQIPQSIVRLPRLKTLGFSYNQLEVLPGSIGLLRELEYLFLDVNKLQEIPRGIGGLSRLKSLSLNHNKLRTLPDSICNLGSLEYLNIEHNPFELLPRCLSEMTNLSDLRVDSSKRTLFMDWSYLHSTKPPQLELEDLSLFIAPGDELYEPLEEALRSTNLSDAVASILPTARNAISLQSTEPDDYSEPGCSRLGGFPDLTDPSLFPKTDDQYWIFLAQINLADLASINRFLPRTGLLSFFVDSTESLNGKVVFHQGSTDKLCTVRHGGAEEMFSPDDDYTSKPHRIEFKRLLSLPFYPPDGMTDDRQCAAYDQLRELLEDTDHLINGHTFTQHESPQEQAANELRGRPCEWIPLLKLGWDNKVGFCFWDAGTLTFCIHQEDLRRWDFSKVHVSLESS